MARELCASSRRVLHFTAFPRLIFPPGSGSGRIPPSRICNQQYGHALKDTNTDKVRFLFP